MKAEKAEFQYGRGCSSYVTCDYAMHIAFPEKLVVCDLCPFCHTENSGTRFRCLETAEILPYHNKGIGMRCPLPLEKPKCKGEDEDD